MGTRKNKSKKTFRKTKKRQRGGHINDDLIIVSEKAPPDEEDLKEIRRLLAQKEINVNARNIYENTPLILAVENVGEVECGDDTDLTEYQIVRLLLEKGANVNAENIYGHTALYLTENKYIQKLLRDKGAKLSEKDKHIRLFEKEIINKSVIDFGCGEGLFLKNIQKNIPYKKLVGVDIFIPNSLKDNPKIKFVSSSIITFRSNEKFDIAFSDNVLEHISILDYSSHVKSGSMFNTPPVFAVYASLLTMRWIEEQGGLKAMAQINQTKSQLLYEYIDNSDLYQNPVSKKYRSWVNIPFTLKDNDLDDIFLSQAETSGLYNLKGHRTVGGMRASVYNAMPVEGVEVLIAFMKDFENKQ